MARASYQHHNHISFGKPTKKKDDKIILPFKALKSQALTQPVSFSKPEKPARNKLSLKI